MWFDNAKQTDCNEALRISGWSRDCWPLHLNSQSCPKHPNWSVDLEEAKIVAVVIFAEQMGVWDIDKQPIGFLEMLKWAYVTPGHPRLFAPRRTEALSVIFHDCPVVAVSLQTHFVNVKVFGVAQEWKKLHAGVNEVQTGLIDLKATVNVLDTFCEGLAVFCFPLQNSRWCALVSTTWKKISW